MKFTESENQPHGYIDINISIDLCNNTRCILLVYDGITCINCLQLY